MGIFKTKKNKRYSYTPRFYKGEANPFKIKHKFDAQRVTVQKTNLKGKFTTAIDDLKSNLKSLLSSRFGK